MQFSAEHQAYAFYNYDSRPPAYQRRAERRRIHEVDASAATRSATRLIVGLELASRRGSRVAGTTRPSIEARSSTGRPCRSTAARSYRAAAWSAPARSRRWTPRRSRPSSRTRSSTFTADANYYQERAGAGRTSSRRASTCSRAAPGNAGRATSTAASRSKSTCCAIRPTRRPAPSRSTGRSTTPTSSRTREADFRDYAFYVQDAWRPTPRLTLNAGVRVRFHQARRQALRRARCRTASTSGRASGPTTCSPPTSATPSRASWVRVHDAPTDQHRRRPARNTIGFRDLYDLDLERHRSRRSSSRRRARALTPNRDASTPTTTSRTSTSATVGLSPPAAAARRASTSAFISREYRRPHDAGRDQTASTTAASSAAIATRRSTRSTCSRTTTWNWLVYRGLELQARSRRSGCSCSAATRARGATSPARGSRTIRRRSSSRTRSPTTRASAALLADQRVAGWQQPGRHAHDVRQARRCSDHVVRLSGVLPGAVGSASRDQLHASVGPVVRARSSRAWPRPIRGSDRPRSRCRTAASSRIRSRRRFRSPYPTRGEGQFRARRAALLEPARRPRLPLRRAPSRGRRRRLQRDQRRRDQRFMSGRTSSTARTTARPRTSSSRAARRSPCRCPGGDRGEEGAEKFQTRRSQSAECAEQNFRFLKETCSAPLRHQEVDLLLTLFLCTRGRGDEVDSMQSRLIPIALVCVCVARCRPDPALRAPRSRAAPARGSTRTAAQSWRSPGRAATPASCSHRGA